jgi:hypothetical protein
MIVISKKNMIFALLLIVNSCIFAQEEFIGNWIIKDPPESFREVSTISIRQNKTRIIIEVMGTYSFIGYYDPENNEIFYAMQGMGYDGPLVRVRLEGKYLRTYYLYRNGWIKNKYLYYKKDK